MAEYIERESALEECDWYANEFCECEYAIMPLKGALENLPAADVRPVVLCKDCKHKGWVQEPEHGKSVDYCRLIERCVDKQFFCAAGEKREES